MLAATADGSPNPAVVHLRRRRPGRRPAGGRLGRRQPGLLAAGRGRRERCSTVDDSFAAEQIAAGVPRHEAENGPQAHAITRWLGLDAPDHTPRTASLRLDTAGLAAGLLRRPVELLLRSGRPRGAGPADCAGERDGRLRSWPGRWSTGPTPRAAATTSPSRSPATTRPDRHRPVRRPTTREEVARDGRVHRRRLPERVPARRRHRRARHRDGHLHRRRRGRAAPATGDAAEIIIVDTSGSMGTDKIAAAQTGGQGGAGPDPRRHVVRGDRRQPRGAAGLPRGLGRAGHGADGRQHPRRRQGRGRPRSAPTAAPRWAPGSTMAARRLRLGPRGHPEARDPADRRRSTSTRRRRR